jgi:hypothetical protein
MKKNCLVNTNIFYIKMVYNYVYCPFVILVIETLYSGMPHQHRNHRSPYIRQYEHGGFVTSEVLATLALLYVNAKMCDASSWKIRQHGAVLAGIFFFF